MPESEDRGYSGARGGTANGSGGAKARIDTAIMTLARLLGHRIAREEFRRLKAANDNAPATDAGER